MPMTPPVRCFELLEQVKFPRKDCSLPVVWESEGNTQVPYRILVSCVHGEAFDAALRLFNEGPYKIHVRLQEESSGV